MDVKNRAVQLSINNFIFFTAKEPNKISKEDLQNDILELSKILSKYVVRSGEKDIKIEGRIEEDFG